MNQSDIKIVPDFNPSIINPFYFVRTGLLKGIRKYALELNGVLLDFGCGSKPYISLFNVDEYIGMDFENPGHPHINENIDVYYDGKNIPFGDNHFDSILCSEVVEHVFNLDDILAELNRVLKPGGKMLMTCPFAWNEHEIPNDFARYTKFALIHKFEQNGFELISYSKSGNFLSTVFQLLTLYFYERSAKSWYRIMPLRVFYKVVFYGFINLMGLFFSNILPKSESLYLNNIVLFRKKSENSI
jgi:SAM-dependent methyltransferase